MGWGLVNTVTLQFLRLRPGVVQIGRAQSAHIKPTHQSVSRLHAELVIEPVDGPIVEIVPLVLKIIDRSSTGHTFVNGRGELGKGKPVVLSDGDSLTFGVDEVTYIVQWAPILMSCSSRMVPRELERMEQQVRAAGAFLTREWTPECTHLLMDQISITPKLLCCVIDGRVPAAESFVEALSKCEVVSLPIDVTTHAPLPPAGADGDYAKELEECFRSPRPRKDMFKGVSVVFGSKQCFEVLAKVLMNAGSEIHKLCVSPDDVPKVAADLKRNIAAGALLREVWVVQAGETVIAALSTALPTSALQHFIVPFKAVVRSILAGSLDIVHRESNLLGQMQQRQANLPRQQQQLQLKQQNQNRKEDVSKKEVKEESFPHTQEEKHDNQPGVKQALAVDVKKHWPLFPKTTDIEPEAKRQRTSKVLGTEMQGSQVRNSQLQEKKIQGDQAQAGSQLFPAVKKQLQDEGDGKPVGVVSVGATKPEFFVRDTPFSASSDAVFKVDHTNNRKDVGAPKPEFFVRDTPLSASSDAVFKVEPVSNRKQEAVMPSHEALPVDAAAFNHTEVSKSMEGRSNQQELGGLWLSALRQPKGSENEASYVSIDGANIPRPICEASARVMKRSPPATTTSTAGNQQVRSTKTNFKVFQKSLGQREGTRGERVSVEPWMPAAVQPLAEVFSSQPFESQSQLPLVF